MARRRARPPVALAEAGADEDRRPPVDDRCPLCDRLIPPGARASRHHLVPRLKGGAKLGTVRLHQICHSTIHALFSEAELARRLSDMDALKADPALAGFLDWIRTKPDDFHAPTSRTRSRRRDRRADHRRP